MVAPRKTKKIFCTVIRVPAADDSSMRASNPRFYNEATRTVTLDRPSDLLPWADPYIARLVSKLQDEVRDERAQCRVATRLAGGCVAELEPPSPGTESDWDWQEEPRWSAHEDS